MTDKLGNIGSLFWLQHDAFNVGLAVVNLIGG